MLYTSLSMAIGLLATAIYAQENPINIPKGGFPVFTAGKPTTITWDPTTSGTVTLRLREGASSDLVEGTLIKANIPNSGTFTYTPPSDTVRNSDYTIEIIDDTNPKNVNYSPQFVIESQNTVSSISSESASASASASSSASSESASQSSASQSSASESSTSASETSASESSMSSSVSASSRSASRTSSGTASSSATATETNSSSSQTAAPTSGAAASYMEMKLSGGLLAAVFGIMAVL